MDQEQEYLTPEKHDALEKELKELKSKKRKEVLEALEFAKSLGDLSENAEYHQAREEQARLEDRISKIESVLKNSVMVSKHHTTSIEVGSTVTVSKEGKKESSKYTIVGTEEADMSTGHISNRSPIGEALLGKKKGDVALVETPKGIIKYKVLGIE